MKIFIAHSSNFDFENKLYKPILDSDIVKNHEVFLPIQNGREAVTKEVIGECDVLFADLSSPSTGAGIELGWADMQNVPVVCIHEEGSIVTPAIKYITNKIFAYKDSDELIKIIKNNIS